MQITNAIKKLKKFGKVEQNGQQYSVTHKGEVVSFRNQDGRIIVIGVRRENDHSDPMTDYSAETYCRNLSQAFRLANWV